MSDVTIVQADREAAADFGRKVGRLSPRDAKNMIDGKWDETADVSAFATYRVASTADLVEALRPFTNLRDQFPQSVKVINKSLDGMTPVTITVTKAQMLAAVEALNKAGAL